MAAELGRRNIATETILKEATMSKHAVLPTSRLICFGGAKACTNAVNTPENPEDIAGLGFGD